MRTPAAFLSAMLLATACGGDDTSGADASPDASTTPDAAASDASPPDAPPTPDAAPPPDARIPDFSCAGDPLPTTAPATINFGGMVSDIILMSAIADMTVEARLRSDDSVLATATSDASGAFSMSYANPSMMPVDAYVRFSKATYNDTYIYPADPLASDVSMLNAIATNMLPLLYTLTTGGPGTPVPTYDMTDGTTIVLVMDCVGDPIAGATVALTPAPDAIGYLDGSTPSVAATATDVSGIAAGYNVPPGEVTVTADYMGTALESHTFESYPNSLTVTIIHP